MIRATLFLLALGATACQSKVENETCNTICTELVMNCAYEAYPGMNSCLQGCLYKTEQGAKMDRAQTCIEQADCDTFAIIECEHAEGVDLE